MSVSVEQSASDASAPPSAAPVILSVRDVVKHFPTAGGWFGKAGPPVRAVDGVSLEVRRGETLGLVGESGCGKTTLGRVIIRLIEGATGDIRLEDSPNLLTLTNRQMLPYRRRMQMIFQDPYSSLNPRMTIGATLAEPLKIHNLATGRRPQRVAELLAAVGLPQDAAGRYPHEFSGGQRQRVGIARALAVEPGLIIADEPVSALDVSIQAQIINLLHELQDQFGLTFLFVAHDLSVVGHMSHRVAVMYLGKIVEIGPRERIFNAPLHPYTEALLQSIPRMEVDGGRKKIVLEGDVPSPINPPPGCPFHPRCAKAMPQCAVTVPPLKEHAPGQSAACLLYE